MIHPEPPRAMRTCSEPTRFPARNRVKSDSPSMAARHRRGGSGLRRGGGGGRCRGCGGGLPGGRLRGRAWNRRQRSASRPPALARPAPRRYNNGKLHLFRISASSPCPYRPVPRASPMPPACSTVRGARPPARSPGADRRAYLQGLLSNDIVALVPGTGCYAAYLTPQGG